MNINHYKEVQIRKHWWVLWYDFRNFGVEVHLDRYSARFSFLCFGVEVEWLDKKKSKTQV